jgi:hypothetical protein
MREGTTSRVTVADRPYGEFYDFYSVSPENFGSTFVYLFILHSVYRGADKSLARPGTKQATATEDFDVHIPYL